MNVLYSKHWSLAVCAAGLERRGAIISAFFKWSCDKAIPGCIFRSLSSDSPSGWLQPAFPRQSLCRFLCLIPSCSPSRLLTGCCYKWLHVDMWGRKGGKVVCLVRRCPGAASSLLAVLGGAFKCFTFSALNIQWPLQRGWEESGQPPSSPERSRTTSNDNLLKAVFKVQHPTPCSSQTAVLKPP